jgi:hypothetical protein
MPETSGPFKFSSPAADEYRDLRAILVDLDHVIWSLNSLLGRTVDPDLEGLAWHNASQLRRVLLTSCLVAYRRCFNSGVRKNLQNDEISDLVTDAAEIHQTALDLANRQAAHSVNPFDQSYAGAIVRDGRVSEIMYVYVDLTESLNRDFFQKFGDLVDKIRKYVQSKRDNAKDAALEEARKKPIDEITSAEPMQLLKAKFPLGSMAGEKRED